MIFLFDTIFSICYSIFYLEREIIVNKYRQSLNYFKEAVNDNKLQQECLKKNKQDKNSEIKQINLQNYEIDKKIIEYKNIKKRLNKYTKKYEDIKKKCLLFTYLVVVSEVFFLGMFSMLGTSIMTLSIIIVLISLSASFVLTFSNTEKLDLKIQNLTKGLTKEEISKKLESLLLQKEVSLLAIEEIKQNIVNIDNKIAELENDILIIYEKYSKSLENYQNFLSSIELKFNSNVSEQEINDYNIECNKLKKAYKNNCD